MAAAVAAGRGAGIPVELLAQTTERSAGTAEVAAEPETAGSGAVLPWSAAAGGDLAGTDRRVAGTEPPRRCNLIYDHADGLRGAAVPVHGRGRRGGGLGDSQPGAWGSGEADRVSGQHAGATGGVEGEWEFAGVAGPGAGELSGSLCEPVAAGEAAGRDAGEQWWAEDGVAVRCVVSDGECTAGEAGVGGSGDGAVGGGAGECAF